MKDAQLDWFERLKSRGYCQVRQLLPARYPRAPSRPHALLLYHRVAEVQEHLGTVLLE